MDSLDDLKEIVKNKNINARIGNGYALGLDGFKKTQYLIVPISNINDKISLSGVINESLEIGGAGSYKIKGDNLVLDIGCFMGGLNVTTFEKKKLFAKPFVGLSFKF